MTTIGLFLKDDYRNHSGLHLEPDTNSWYLSSDAGQTPLKPAEIAEILNTQKWIEAHAFEGDYIKSDADAVSIYQEIMTK